MKRFLFAAFFLLVSFLNSVTFAQFKPYEGEEKEISVPGTIGDAVLAGGGRYLLLHLKELNKVAVYDANKADITDYLSIGNGDATIIGGASKMIVVNHDQNIIQRWSLETRKRELTKTLPFSGVFKTMAMGYNSEGPLLIHWANGTSALDRASYSFLDLDSLDMIDGLENARADDHSYRDAVHIRAAANGKVFGMWATSHSPQGMSCMILKGKKTVFHDEHTSGGHIWPMPNGSTLATGRGIFTRTMSSRSRSNLPCYATTVDGFYLKLAVKPGRQNNTKSDKYKDEMGLYTTAENKKICSVPFKSLGPIDSRGWERHDFLMDKRIFYIVQSKQLLTIPATDEVIRVTPFDLTKELDNSDMDYMIVTSSAPNFCIKGEEFQHKVEWLCSSKNVSLELSSAPDGMTISQTGEVRWDVPKDAKSEFVIVTLTSDDDQTKYDTFELKIKEK